VSILSLSRRRGRRSPAERVPRGAATARWVRSAWPLYLTRPAGWVIAGLFALVVLAVGGYR